MRGAPVFAAAIVVVAALLAPSPAAAAPVPAQSAAAFRDSVGVQTHIVYYDTAYGDWPRIVQKLDELGVDHLRDGAYANPDWRDWNERYYQAVELAAAHGKRFLFNMGEPGFNAGTLDQLVSVVSGRLRGATDALEGPNEYDLTHGGPDWASELATYQRDLYLKAKAEPLLRDVPVVGPSLVYDNSDNSLGALGTSADYGNIHPYTSGEPPSAQQLQGRFDAVRPVFGAKPLFATEAGFHNALATDHGQNPVPEDVGAAYLLRTYLEHFRAGVRRTYAYELIDEQPDPALRDPELHFGLLRNDFSEKPAFTALQRMLTLVGRPGAVDPQPLDLGISGDTNGIQTLLLQKSDRHYTLALWQTGSEWDAAQRRRLPLPDRQVQLTLPGEANVAVSRPVRAGDQGSHGNVRQASIAVPADPVLVELDFGSRPPATQPAPPAPTVPASATKPIALVAAPAVSLARTYAFQRARRCRARGIDASFSRRRSRGRPLVVRLCSALSGTALVELRRGGAGRVLARRRVRVMAGRQVAILARLSPRALARLGRGRPAVRVRFKSDGGRYEPVAARALPAQR